MLLSLSLPFQFAITFTLHIVSTTATYKLKSSQNPRAQVGIHTQEILSFSSHEDQYEARIYEFQIQWKYVDPAVSDSIKHNCGADWLTPLISLDTNKDNDIKPVGVNCSFTKDKAMVTLAFQGTKSVYFNGNFIELSTNSFKGDQEVCTLKLRGYEKFPKIFLAYVFDKDKLVDRKDTFSLIKFPEGFNSLIGRKSSVSGSDFVLFNPNEGKGKRFKHTKKCLEVLIGNESMEEIYDHCIFDCDDFDEDLGDSPLGRRIEL